MKSKQTIGAIAVVVFSSGLFGCATKPPPERATLESIRIDKSGRTRPPLESWKSQGTLGAGLVLVGEGEELYKRWNTPSEIFEVSTVDQVPINGSVSAYLVSLPATCR